jgi:uncharacterized protein
VTTDAKAVARLDLLDSVRGFALMGLFLVHSVEQYELFWSHPDYGNVFQWVFALFSGKAYALMALCFGVSFFLIMDSAARRGEDFAGRFAWRLAILFAMGLVHGLIYRGDFLQTIAFTGFAMLFLDRIKNNRVLRVVAAVCLLELPLFVRAWAASAGVDWAAATPLYYDDPGALALANGSFLDVIRANATDGFIVKWSYFVEAGRLPQMLGLFIVGLVLGRAGFFRNPDAFKVRRRWVLAMSVVLSTFLYFYAQKLLETSLAETPVRKILHTIVESWTGLALMTSEMLMFVELFQSVVRPIASAFAAPGKMTLTLYVSQSIIMTPIFYGYGLGLHDDWSPMACLALGLVVWPLQMLFAHWWFRRFHYGPLEWLWRAATRTSLDVPFLRRASPAALQPA